MKNTSNEIYKHFTDISTSYNELRTTDLEPVLYIKEKLKDRKGIRAVDIGCGAGRYDLLLFENIEKLFLICVDINESMLEEVSNLLKSKGIKNFNTKVSDIEHLSLKKNSLDCVFTFNAIHHFDFFVFLQKATKFLIDKGLIFIYTRLQSQNKRNIWGRYFPMFIDREDRLYELEDMTDWVKLEVSLKIESIDYFKMKRKSTLDRLSELARCRHYSTFCLYEKDEFKYALKTFKENIQKNFSDVNNVYWYDENVMLTLRYKK